jgi:hypothetical protein
LIEVCNKLLTLDSNGAIIARLMQLLSSSTMRWTAKTPGFRIDSAARTASRDDTEEHGAALDPFPSE